MNCPSFIYLFIFGLNNPGIWIYVLLWWADIRVLVEHAEFQSMSAINSIYNNSAIFGIQASTVSNDWISCVDVLSKCKLNVLCHAIVISNIGKLQWISGFRFCCKSHWYSSKWAYCTCNTWRRLSLLSLIPNCLVLLGDWKPVTDMFFSLIHSWPGTARSR